jgi:hypothetical protein
VALPLQSLNRDEAMTWKLWSLRPPVQLRVNLGHGLNSWIRCMNLLIEHRIRLLKLIADEERPQFSVGPISIQMTLRHPGRKRLRALISDLNRSTYGCREEAPPQQDSEWVSSDEEG